MAAQMSVQRIFLIGFMGAGKTTLGRVLAKDSGWSFIDLDWYIEQRMHQSIPTLFAERGEAGFRLVEREKLLEVAEIEHVIISTGGGTPCFFDNIHVMKRAGLTIFLDVSIDRLFIRLRMARQQRPMLQGQTDEELRSYIADKLHERLPYYTQAELVFRSDKLENKSQITESVCQLKSMIHPMIVK